MGLPSANIDPSIPLPKPTRDVQQGLADLAEHGLAIHEGLVPNDFAARLEERLDEQAYMERKTGGAFVGSQLGIPSGRASDIDSADKQPIYQAMHSLPNKGRVFVDLFMNETTHAYAKGLFDPYPWCLWGMNGIIVRKGAVDQPLHTDVWLPPEMSTRPVMFNCFVAVSDFEADMGATGFVPGSHKGPYPSPEGGAWFKTPRVQVEIPAGSAIIWEGRTWHGQCAHTSERTRYAIAMSYCLFTYRQGENYAASLHDDVYETLSEEELRVLGFYTDQVGFLGYFGPRNPSDKRSPIGMQERFLPELHREDKP